VEDAVASAFDMRGTFNDIAMTLAPGAVKASVIHGGARADQPRWKALGFPNLPIALNYFKFVSVIAQPLAWCLGDGSQALSSTATARSSDFLPWRHDWNPGSPRRGFPTHAPLD
jgi:hypothetical protein